MKSIDEQAAAGSSSDGVDGILFTTITTIIRWFILEKHAIIPSFDYAKKGTTFSLIIFMETLVICTDVNLLKIKNCQVHQ
jgi:hypothetical protein